MNYIQEALRTDSGESEVIRHRAAGYVRPLHAALGLATESGELVDILKRAIFYGKEIDRVHVIEEVGDLFWYLAILSDSLGFTFEECQKKNIEKLRARYPERFTENLALNRDLSHERSVLES